MATFVAFHAHPDDEAISTGGTMAKAAADGHEVVLVLATRGEQGKPQPGVLGEGERLGDRREREAHAAAEVLGASRVEFLGYVDSGMMGEPTNDHPGCFWQADVDEAAERLAGILRDVGADVLTVYDEHGGYGHPDHIQVHRVGMRAAELVGTARVYMATINRDHIRRQLELIPEGDELVDEERRAALDSDHFGVPEERITHAVDVSGFLEHKRAAMAVHASQIADDMFFLAMAPDVFALAFGTEWFIVPGQDRSGGPFATDLFER